MAPLRSNLRDVAALVRVDRRVLWPPHHFRVRTFCLGTRDVASHSYYHMFRVGGHAYSGGQFGGMRSIPPAISFRQHFGGVTLKCKFAFAPVPRELLEVQQPESRP